MALLFLETPAGETVNLQVIRLWNADGPRADEVVIETKHPTLYRLLVQNVVANNRRETAERPHLLRTARGPVSITGSQIVLTYYTSRHQIPTLSPVATTWVTVASE
jgi:hypothetical protein